MTPNRWTLALESGALALPSEADVLVFRARGDADFSALGQVRAVQGFRPDHDALARRGIEVSAVADGTADAALVQIVKSKPESFGLIAEALTQVAPGGVVMVDGQKEEGIESLLKAVRAVLPVTDVLSKSHGKLFWLTRPEALPEEVEAWRLAPQEIEGGYVTFPGLFSADGPDQGSELLVALLPQLKGRVADLGAGWGYLAGEVLKEQEGITSLDLIEADWAALEAAKENVPDSRAASHWADATAFTPADPYDAIICNPPFHTGRKADPALGRAFIQAAARMLTPSGQFFMVANRHLPYEAALKAAFGTGKMLAELHGYKLYQAAKPKRA